MKTVSKRLMLLAALSCTLAAGAVSTALAQELPVAPPPQHRLVTNNLWVILTTDTDGFKRPKGLIERHLAHQVELEKKGIMFGAGPVSTPDGKHEYGMIIIRAGSAAEAKRIADSDPMHQTGARHYVLHQWALNEGQVTYSINLSDSSASFK